LTSACIGAGDSTTVADTEEQLRTAEIQDIFATLSEAFGAAGVDVSPQSPAATAGIQMAPVPMNSTFDVSVPCESGNVIVSGVISGTLDDQTMEGDMSLQLAWEFEACVLTSSYGAITLNGNPSIQFLANYLFGAEQWTVNATQGGGFTYAVTDGRNGSCLIDLTYGATYSLTTGDATESVTGAVCGRSAEEFENFLM
jgi:hypothetical protein